MTIGPISGKFAVLADDAPEVTDGGIIVNASGWRTNLDFYVIRGHGDGFGQGDRVILNDPMCGRRICIDGVPMRIVRVEDIIGVVS